MNQFSEIYTQSPEDILRLVKKISIQKLTSQLISNFCEAEYRLFDIFNYDKKILDISGSGGAKYNTINVGTISAFIIASLGIPVVKLSFPSYSNTTGSADALNAYQIPIRKNWKDIKNDLEKYNLSFIQRNYNKEGLQRNKKMTKIAHLMPKDSIFRILGPLCHPLRPNFRIYGLSNKKYGNGISDYLSKVTSRFMVVSGESGIDEIDICDVTKIWEVNSEYTFKLESLGIKPSKVNDIRINKKDNVRLVKTILELKAQKPFIDLVIINVAGALKICKGLDWQEAYEMAKNELWSKRPLKLFQAMTHF